jgi:hypothetical protein
LSQTGAARWPAGAGSPTLTATGSTITLREVFRGLDRMYADCGDQLSVDDGNYDNPRYSDVTPAFWTWLASPDEQFLLPEGAEYCGDLGPADRIGPEVRVIIEWPPYPR